MTTPLNDRVLELWQELNVLAEVSTHAADIVNSYKAAHREGLITFSDAEAVITLPDNTTFNVHARVELLDLSGYDAVSDEVRKEIQQMPDGAIKLLFSFMRGLAINVLKGREGAQQSESGSFPSEPE